MRELSFSADRRKKPRIVANKIVNKMISLGRFWLSKSGFICRTNSLAELGIIAYLPNAASAHWNSDFSGYLR